MDQPTATSLTVAYQGMAGAFSEAAAAALFPEARLEGQRTFAEVFSAVAERRVDAAVVPLENSHAGSVVEVYDQLLQHRTVTMVAEAMVRVRYCLLGVPGATLAQITAVRSHPQSLSQCDEWLRAHRIEPIVAFDNAGAAAEVAAAKDRSVAGLASRRAGRHYGLAVLADAIETAKDNVTRFVAIALEPDGSLALRVPAALRTGPRKTSLVYATRNEPGALTGSLAPFAAAGLQLTKIESRPSKAAPWDYVFYLDFEGDPEVRQAGEALDRLRAVCAWVQVLGTYAAATKVLEPD